MRRVSFPAVLLVGLVLAGLVLAGCAGGGRYWREEVALADGRMLVVERWQELGHPLAREIPDLKFGPPVVGYGLDIPIPGTKKTVRWETDRSLSPLAIGVKEATVYLAASPRTCPDFDRWGRPVPPYVFFKHDGGEWKRIVVEEFPQEIAHANLLVGAQAREVESGYVSTDMVRRGNLATSHGRRNIYRSGTAGFGACILEFEQLEKNRRK